MVSDKELYDRIRISPDEDHQLIMKVAFKKMMKEELTENERIIQQIAKYLVPHCTEEELKYLRAIINKELARQFRTKDEIIEDLHR